MSAGQPSKYHPDYCELLVQHMEQGLSFESFAGLVRVHRDTLYEWVKVHPEFSDAKKIGRELGLLYWEKVGRDGLYNETIKSDDGMTVNRSINSTIWIFNMKNRYGWRDNKPEGEGGERKPIVLAYNLEDEEEEAAQ